MFHPQALATQSRLPMNYYTVFRHISQLLPRDCIIVSEGANTMDIGRTMLNNYLPRHRQGSQDLDSIEAGHDYLRSLKQKQCEIFHPALHPEASSNICDLLYNNKHVTFCQVGCRNLRNDGSRPRFCHRCSGGGEEQQQQR